MSPKLDYLVRGGLAGLFATGLMTIVIAGGRAARLLRVPPPKQITARAEWKAGVRQRLNRPAFEASWVVAHLGYGVICGALYTLVRPLLPRSTTLAGLLYGGGVWAASYLGLMPSLGLYPWPPEDRPTRTAVMVLAHFVYGLALAEADRRLGGLEPTRLLAGESRQCG